MNKRIKALSLIIAIMVMICSLSYTAFATGGEGEDPNAVVSNPGYEDPGNTPDPGNEDPGNTPDPGNEDPYVPGGEEPVDTPDPGYEDPGYEDPGVSGGSGGSGGNYVDSYTDGNGYYYYDEDRMAQSLEDTAGNVRDYTTLYNTNIDDKALEQSKWNKITLDTGSMIDEAGDFTAIKENKSVEDNGEWILYLGIALIVLALLGILYFVVATATYRKKLKSLRARDQRQGQRRYGNAAGLYEDGYDAGDHRGSQSSSRPQHRQRRRYASDDMSYSERKRLKSDTAEVYLPKRYAEK